MCFFIVSLIYDSSTLSWTNAAQSCPVQHVFCLQVHKNASVSVCFSFYSHTFTDECQRRCAHPIVVINLHTATVYSQSVSAIQSLSRVSIALWKEPQSDTAISHSMALPNPISSHVDCIRIGGPGAQREARGYLSYLWPERWFRKSTWSGWAGLLRLPCRRTAPALEKLFPEPKAVATLGLGKWLLCELHFQKVYTLHRRYDLHFIYLHHITPTCKKKKTHRWEREISDSDTKHSWSTSTL